MYQLRAPALALQAYIEHYWFVTSDEGPVDLRVEVFVDARADLVFNFGAPYQREVIGGATVEHTRSNLDAQRMVPIRIRQRGRVRCSGVRFQLGGLGPFVTGPLRALTGTTPPPCAVWGPEATGLERSLAQTPSLDAQARALDDFFLRRMETGGAFAHFEHTLRQLVASGGASEVAQVAASVDVTARHLERLFARYLGIAPSAVARVLRFQRALRALMREPAGTLSDVAADAGYFDHAHFIREFRRMTGGVPRGYRGYYPPEGPGDFAPNVVVFVQDAPP